MCPNDNNGGKLSKFTVDDTVNGNGNLTYKIGTLTADEIAFAGASGANSNLSIYLQENTGENRWWTLSPVFFAGKYAGVLIMDSFGELTNYFAYYAFNFRPAISLVSDITISGGTGTSEDPYIIN